MTDVSTGSATPTRPELLGQTVVVIGGARASDSTTARRARAEGADVVLTGRDPERLRHAAEPSLGRRSSASAHHDHLGSHRRDL